MEGELFLPQATTWTFSPTQRPCAQDHGTPPLTGKASLAPRIQLPTAALLRAWTQEQASLCQLLSSLCPCLSLPRSAERGKPGAGGRQGSGTGPPGHRQPCRAGRPPRWLWLWPCSLTPRALTFQGKKAWGCFCPESRRDCSSWKGTNWRRSRVHTSHTTCDTERGARRQPSGAPTAGRPVGRQGTAGGLSCAHSGPTGLPEVPSLLPTQECHLPVCLLWQCHQEQLVPPPTKGLNDSYPQPHCRPGVRAPLCGTSPLPHPEGPTK